MTSWAHDPDASASALIASALDDLELGDRVLIASADATLLKRLQAQREAVLWSRRSASSAIVSPDPPPGPFSSALLRLPKAREEQAMTAHQCLGALASTGCLYVYGGNSEGIRTFQKTLATLGSVETSAARGHGRILAQRRTGITGDVKALHSAWREVLDEPRGWVTFPGLFAAGTADAGTALLIEHLPDIAREAKVLDYGCGPGAISAGVRRRQQSARLTLIDNDSIALLAARENVPGAELCLGRSLDAVGTSQFDMIVSNPPLHVGFREDMSLLHRLVAEAPNVLTEEGILLLVVQRRIALDRAMTGSFSAVEIVADDGRYRVWRASGRLARRPPSSSRQQQ